MRNGGKTGKWAARSERLSAALRENLKRRKAQARARGQTPGGEAKPQPAQAEPELPDFRRNPGGK
jgi:hypothetical protein